MDLTLTRVDLTPTRTIGSLYLAGTWECFTLEDQVREPGVKVPGATAIPPGRYQVLLTFSQRFQRLLPLLLHVPWFTGIRIHAGNTAADTEGCILVGQERAGDQVLKSRAALEVLLLKLGPASKQDDVWITVS